MSTKAFLWCGLNMVILLVFGVAVGRSEVHGASGFVVGLVVGVISYQVAKSMIRAGPMT